MALPVKQILESNWRPRTVRAPLSTYFRPTSGPWSTRRMAMPITVPRKTGFFQHQRDNGTSGGILRARNDKQDPAYENHRGRGWPIRPETTGRDLASISNISAQTVRA